MYDIFTFTDVHGRYDLYHAIMTYCHEQDPEAMIIYCGDANDRGPRGYDIMHELLDNPHVVYLKGNHEDLFVKAAKEINEHFSFANSDDEAIRKTLKSCMYFDEKYYNIQVALRNGAMPTLLDWIHAGKPMDFVERIEKLPLTFSTDTCDFCHAAGVYQTFKSVADAEYEGKEAEEVLQEQLLWSRTAFKYGWTPNRTVIFGHTPVPYLLQNLDIPLNPNNMTKPYKYIGTLQPEMTGAKIDMDTGAVFTNVIYVLNVLTMQAQGFMEIEGRVEKIKMIQM